MIICKAHFLGGFLLDSQIFKKTSDFQKIWFLVIFNNCRAFCPNVHMETKRTRRSFSPEFKKQAVQRVLLLKEPAANVSAELEIKPETLSKWIKDYEKMVAEDPSYAAAGAPKRPVIKLAKKGINIPFYDILEMKEILLKNE